MTKSGFDLDEIERLLAAVTPGKWEYLTGEALVGNFHVIEDSYGSMVCECWDGASDDQEKANAALIVAARNSLPAILTEIRELRATVATLGDSARAGANVLDAKDTEITRLRAALRQIQDEGDAHSNAIATATLGGSDEQNPA